MVKTDSKSPLPYDDLMVKEEKPKKQLPALDDGDLCFDENSNDEDNQLLLDSPKESVNSSVVEYDDEEEDEFEDAEEGASDDQSEGKSEGEEIDT
mmetsp:Transcript_25632/g.39444  ORF Transcript_25632/g.39444 Transcript_25632/m.39444 type:complete len:95 (+) Transcript_25632:1020-1304(+)